jgi:hypothetical protein
MSSATFISTLPTDDASWQIHLPFLPLLEAEALILDRFSIPTRYHELLP